MNYKAEAEKIVEKYMPFARGFIGVSIQHENAIQCAILEVEAVMKVIDKIQRFNEYRDYKQILNQLKQM